MRDLEARLIAEYYRSQMEIHEMSHAASKVRDMTRTLDEEADSDESKHLSEDTSPRMRWLRSQNVILDDEHVNPRDKRRRD